MDWTNLPPDSTDNIPLTNTSEVIWQAFLELSLGQRSEDDLMHLAGSEALARAATPASCSALAEMLRSTARHLESAATPLRQAVERFADKLQEIGERVLAAEVHEVAEWMQQHESVAPQWHATGAAAWAGPHAHAVQRVAMGRDKKRTDN